MNLQEALKQVPTDTLIHELERRRAAIDHALETRLAWEKREGKILAACANAWGLSTGRLFEKSRVPAVTEARQAAMVLMTRLEHLSSPEVAAVFGMDHSTVLHANKTHEGRMTDPRFARNFEKAEQKLSHGI